MLWDQSIFLEGYLYDSQALGDRSMSELYPEFLTNDSFSLLWRKFDFHNSLSMLSILVNFSSTSYIAKTISSS